MLRYLEKYTTHKEAPDTTHQTGHSLVEIGQQLGRARGVSPVAHQVADDGEHGQDMHSVGTHAVVRVVRDALVEASRGFGICVDGVSLRTKGECEECSADLM